MERLDPVEAARLFVEEQFPECSAALVGGSVIRGEGTTTSDLDIVILTGREEAPFRASYMAHGWPMETFVHNWASLLHYFSEGVARSMPSLPTICAEGVVLRDQDGLAQRAKQEARRLLDAGPVPLTAEQIEARRYALTDMLDNLLGADSIDDGLLIANDVAVAAAELVLLINHRWIGHGRWLVMLLSAYDPSLASSMLSGLRRYYQDGDKEELVAFVTGILDLAGGRMFEGFYREGER